ncbi:MAG: universal stress protein [Solirubrobacterales bacterium]|nr:universal stress protein [Solirubrobacterales bacterium]
MSDTTRVIVSYDGTYNEDDAVALGRLFGVAGAELALAYVRHAPEDEVGREVLVEHDAEQLLGRGVELLGGLQASRHVITDRSTPKGLSGLAERKGAQVIVFCSDSHTARGHIAIGNSAQRLLEGGTTAIAIAPAGYAARELEGRAKLLAATGDAEDPAVEATARALADALGASVTSIADESADLLIVGSRPEAGAGRIALSAAAHNLIEEVATCPVLVLPRGVALSFEGHPAVTA